MTIRIQHLTIRPTDDTYLRAPQDGVSMLTTHAYDTVLLGMVRHILRDEACDMVPVVLSACAHPVNQYGHNVQMEVTYSSRGYRAIFAGHYDAATRTLSRVQCYMD